MPVPRRTKLPPLADLMDSGQAASYAGWSVKTLHRRAAEGVLTKYYLGSRLRWSRPEIDALVSGEQPESVARSVGAMRSASPGGAR